MTSGPLFVVTQALNRAISFVLGWATSLFFGQIPGGKERVVSMLSAIALAWCLLTYVGAPFAVLFKPEQAIVVLLGVIALPAFMMLIAETSHLTEGFSPVRWLRSIPAGYPAAISLGSGIALMLAIGPVVLWRRRRSGLRTHHIPVLVAEGRFHELVTEIADELGRVSERDVFIGSLGGAWRLPMHAMRYAAARLFRSIVRDEPVIVVAGRYEVAIYAMDVNVTAPGADAYSLRAAIYKRLGLARVYLTWSKTSQGFERRLWDLRRGDLARHELEHKLATLERDIDRAPIGSDEWNVLYRALLQLRAPSAASSSRRSA